MCVQREYVEVSNDAATSPNLTESTEDLRFGGKWVPIWTLKSPDDTPRYRDIAKYHVMYIKCIKNEMIMQTMHTHYIYNLHVDALLHIYIYTYTSQ